MPIGRLLTSWWHSLTHEVSWLTNESIFKSQSVQSAKSCWSEIKRIRAKVRPLEAAVGANEIGTEGRRQSIASNDRKAGAERRVDRGHRSVVVRFDPDLRPLGPVSGEEFNHTQSYS